MANMLDKYGVPLPSGRNSAMTQPKMKNRFRVILERFGIDADDKDYMALEVEEVTRPKINFNSQTVWTLGRSTTYVGSESWEPIVLTIRDGIGNGATKALARQVQKQRDFHRRISDKSVQKTASYKFGMYIQTLSGENRIDSIEDFTRNTLEDIAEAVTNNPALINSVSALISGGDRTVLESFYCTGCMITDVDYGDFDYTTANPVTIKITIKPDNVTQFDSLDTMYADQIETSDEDLNKVLNVLDNLFKP